MYIYIYTRAQNTACKSSPMATRAYLQLPAATHHYQSLPWKRCQELLHHGSMSFDSMPSGTFSPQGCEVGPSDMKWITCMLQGDLMISMEAHPFCKEDPLELHLDSLHLARGPRVSSREFLSCARWIPRECAGFPHMLQGRPLGFQQKIVTLHACTYHACLHANHACVFPKAHVFKQSVFSRRIGSVK